MNIRVRRETIGMNQQELADAAGVSRVAITRYESGQRVPPLDIAVRIAAALGCKADDLIDHKEN
ncbi:MAG: helix-turn-helix transcriptional regulator [Clostridia bacterium]|nr:helix-turn-helix transcriptional regulator [Clostridia bacterium]